MIPEFPVFKSLELDDKEEIDNITNKFPPYSDFHFISILCWGFVNSTKISILNNNLIFKYIDCLTGEQFYSFVGLNSIPKTVNILVDFLYQNKLPLTFKWVPEVTAKCLDGIEAHLTEDRNYSDYIYDVSDLYHAKGNNYKRYRHTTSTFIKKHPFISTQLIDISSSEVKSQINNLFKTWYDKKNPENTDCDSSLELKALNKLLSSANNVKNLISIGIFDNGVMIAFSIDYIIDKEFGCGLFWKANIDYIGAYQFLMKVLINYYHSNGLKFMNQEFDLGLQSLRDSKLYYRPSFFLKKYTIEINDSFLLDGRTDFRKQNTQHV